jgi:hypothetical protein
MLASKAIVITAAGLSEISIKDAQMIPDYKYNKFKYIDKTIDCRTYLLFLFMGAVASR